MRSFSGIPLGALLAALVGPSSVASALPPAALPEDWLVPAVFFAPVVQPRSYGGVWCGVVKCSGVAWRARCGVAWRVRYGAARGGARRCGEVRWGSYRKWSSTPQQHANAQDHTSGHHRHRRGCGANPAHGRASEESTARRRGGNLEEHRRGGVDRCDGRSVMRWRHRFFGNPFFMASLFVHRNRASSVYLGHVLDRSPRCTTSISTAQLARVLGTVEAKDEREGKGHGRRRAVPQSSPSDVGPLAGTCAALCLPAGCTLAGGDAGGVLACFGSSAGHKAESAGCCLSRTTGPRTNRPLRQLPYPSHICHPIRDPIPRPALNVAIASHPPRRHQLRCAT